MSYQTDARSFVRRPILQPSPLQRYMPSEFRVEQHDEVAFIATSGDGPEEKTVFVCSAVSPARILARADQFFGPGEYSIVIESDTNPALVMLLDRAGWIVDEDEPAMLLRPIPPIPDQDGSLRVERVLTEQQFDDFLRISETGRRWIPSLEAATDPAVCLLVGYLAGRPVATARISCLDDLGDINGVVTEPAFRRRGFGTEMTWAAISAGSERGCTAITLTATEMGYPVYEKMGFVPICRYRTYVQEARS